MKQGKGEEKCHQRSVAETCYAQTQRLVPSTQLDPISQPWAKLGMVMWPMECEQPDVDHFQIWSLNTSHP